MDSQRFTSELPPTAPMASEEDDEVVVQRVTWEKDEHGVLKRHREPVHSDEDDVDDDVEPGPEEESSGEEIPQDNGMVYQRRHTIGEVRKAAAALLDCRQKNCGKCLVCREHSSEEENTGSVDLKRYFKAKGVESLERQIAMCRTYANYLSQQIRAKQPIIKRIKK